MRARFVCLLLLLWSTASSMGRVPPPLPVYRCGPATALRYQDVPCGAGEPATQWQPPPGGPSAAPRAYTGRVRQPPAVPARRRTRHVQHGPAAALITLQQDPEGCRRMKQAREAALRRRQRPAGYLVEREWEDRVHDACR